MDRVLTFATVAAAAALTVGCAAGNSGSSGTSHPSPTPVQFGQAATDGKLEFRATNLLRGPTLTRLGLTDFLPKPAGEYVVVRLVVRNVTDETKLYSASAQKLSAGGQQYDDDGLAEVALPNNHPTVDITKGSTLETTVIFDVPTGIPVDALLVHDSLNSQGASIRLTDAPVEPLAANSAAPRRILPSAL